MKKKHLLLFFLIVSIFSNSQENKVDGKGKKQGYWKKMFPATSITDYEGTFKDDIPVGEFKYYFKNGKIKAKMFFKENGNVSYTTIFHEDETNKPIASGKYINKQKDSIWNYWGPSGRISMIETYKEGVLDGKKSIYYVPELVTDSIPIVAQELNFKQGLREGEQKYFFDNGVLKSKANYINDKIDGELILNSPTGIIEMKENYVNGIKEGWSYVYDDKGNFVSKVYFVAGDKLDEKQTKKYLEKLNNKK
jgi:antitoxin component YwqK of YwqJK toxin-antitoxin module